MFDDFEKEIPLTVDFSLLPLVTATTQVPGYRGHRFYYIRQLELPLICPTSKAPHGYKTSSTDLNQIVTANINEASNSSKQASVTLKVSNPILSEHIAN
ncbi:hypothetical protein QE152_g10240 [Popillia japonica]|uniref:Uncharacterized protein n=1 Tax=Popillia japonica TaxID=7064 RepID=A0AAW1LW80_POPJA